MLDKNEDVYDLRECCYFRFTRAAHGELSNFHPNRPAFELNGLTMLDTETLYQILKHMANATLQHQIAATMRPGDAKRIARSSPISHPNWEEERVRAMRFALRTKRERCTTMIDAALERTEKRPIVEYSRFDAFWGAKPTQTDTLKGCNVLGKLWMELRDQIENGDPKAKAKTWSDGWLVDGRPIEWN